MVKQSQNILNLKKLNFNRVKLIKSSPIVQAEIKHSEFKRMLKTTQSNLLFTVVSEGSFRRILKFSIDLMFSYFIPVHFLVATPVTVVYYFNLYVDTANTLFCNVIFCLINKFEFLFKI